MNIGFIIWLLCAALFVILGIRSMRSKKQVGFFANVQPPKVRDIPAYNRAVGKLLIGFAVVLALLGIPLLWPDTALVLLSVAGTMLEVIVVIVLYLRIEQKHKIK
ncbi:MAG: hypothetical protein Q4D42_01915 [Eubacteriales bacterium]|nr:hypothetical protein [Eubacteriales bacterium]